MRTTKKLVSAALIGVTVLLAGATPTLAHHREHGRSGRHHHHRGPVFIAGPPVVWGPAYVHPYPPYRPAVVYVPPPPPIWIRIR